MNKKLSSIAWALMAAGSCLADEVPALKITNQDGERAVVLSELLSIRFTESDMVVNMKDGTKQVFELDDILVMQVGQMPADLRSIFADSDILDICTVTDINGQVVAKGRLTDRHLLPAKPGVYILTMGGKSKTIIVK